MSECVRYARSGNVNLQLNSIFAIEKRGKFYVGIGLDPIEVIDEDEFPNMNKIRFFKKLVEMTAECEYKKKIFMVSIEKINAVQEDGTKRGNTAAEIYREYGANTDQNVAGSVHAYVLIMSSGSNPENPLFLKADEQSSTPTLITPEWLGNIQTGFFFSFRDRCKSNRLDSVAVEKNGLQTTWRELLTLFNIETKKSTKYPSFTGDCKEFDEGEYYETMNTNKGPYHKDKFGKLIELLKCDEEIEGQIQLLINEGIS